MIDTHEHHVAAHHAAFQSGGALAASYGNIAAFHGKGGQLHLIHQDGAGFRDFWRKGKRSVGKAFHKAVIPGGKKAFDLLKQHAVPYLQGAAKKFADGGIDEVAAAAKRSVNAGVDSLAAGEGPKQALKKSQTAANKAETLRKLRALAVDAARPQF